MGCNGEGVILSASEVKVIANRYNRMSPEEKVAINAEVKRLLALPVVEMIADLKKKPNAILEVIGHISDITEMVCKYNKEN